MCGEFILSPTVVNSQGTKTLGEISEGDDPLALSLALSYNYCVIGETSSLSLDHSVVFINLKC